MSHVPHELAEDFPEAVDLIHRLKQEDPHFARLADAYHDVNRQVHRAECDIEPMDDAGITVLRKERMRLKDEIAALLRAHA
ncbi:MAG: YdcH family protein [Pseudomonadota bacterium]